MEDSRGVKRRRYLWGISNASAEGPECCLRLLCGRLPEPVQGVVSIISRDLFEQLLLHRNDGTCLAHGFY